MKHKQCKKGKRMRKENNWEKIQKNMQERKNHSNYESYEREYEGSHMVRE